MGRSTLLATLTEDITTVSGKVTMAGSVAYVAQAAFILNETVENNILFSKPRDERKYQNALKVSQLEADVANLANGDQTEIGTKNI